MAVRPEKPTTSLLTAQDLFLTVKTPAVVKVEGGRGWCGQGAARCQGQDLTWQWGSTKLQIEWCMVGVLRLKKRGEGTALPPPGPGPDVI